MKDTRMLRNFTRASLVSKKRMFLQNLFWSTLLSHRLLSTVLDPFEICLSPARPRKTQICCSANTSLKVHEKRRSSQLCNFRGIEDESSTEKVLRRIRASIPSLMTALNGRQTIQFAKSFEDFTKYWVVVNSRPH